MTTVLDKLKAVRLARKRDAEKHKKQLEYVYSMITELGEALTNQQMLAHLNYEEFLVDELLDIVENLDPKFNKFDFFEKSSEKYKNFHGEKND